MNDADFQLLSLRDPRLAERATDSAPAWLWTADGQKVLWANPAAVRIFNASNARELSERAVGPADQHRRQVAQLAQRLPADGATRLERLRGFGAALGMLTTCACSRLKAPGDISAVLVIADEPGGRSMPLENRLAMLIDALDDPAAAFSRNGSFVAANHAAQALPGFAAALARLNIDHLALHVIDGKAADPAHGTQIIDTPLGVVSLDAIGTGNDAGWIGIFSDVILPAAEPTPVISSTMPAVIPALTAVTLPLVADAVADAAVSEPSTDHRADRQDASQDALALAAVSAAETKSHQPESDMASAAVAPAGVVTQADSSHGDDSPIESAIAHAFPQDAASEIGPPATTLSDTRPPAARQYPLRFLWQMDRDSRFSLGSDEFQRLIGNRTAFAIGRLWSDLAGELGLDPDNRVAQAVATHTTWGSITVHWPVDGSDTRLPIELSGLPVYDRARTFIGYRGFGVCRDLEGLARLSSEREDDDLFGTSAVAASVAATASLAKTLSSQEQDNHAHQDIASRAPSPTDVQTDTASPTINNLSAASTSAPAMTNITRDPTHLLLTAAHEPQQQADVAPNVVPFRVAGETRPPSLSVKETNTFNEIARQLSARLEGEGDNTAEASTSAPPIESAVTSPAAGPDAFPAWLSQSSTTPHANSTDTQLLGRIPVGVLVYRLDRMIYANGAFLDHAGFENLHAFGEAGGLDTLYIEPGANGDSTSDNGVPLVITGSNGNGNIHARLYSIVWDGEPAMALIYAAQPEAAAVTPPAPALLATASTRDAQHDLAEELSAILDTTAEGVLMFDGLGRMSSCNRSAEALFGRDGADIIQGNLIDLFAPESQRIILDYLQSVKSTGVASLLDHGREVMGRARGGGAIPLAVTMGRTRPDGARYFAVFRDLSHLRKRETELLNARKAAERMANAKSDILGKLSHEVRAPLGAIVGFADVMIQERFGSLGNDRYVEYMKDIRASGERVTTIIDDLLDLSRVESGKLDLSLTNQDLNTMVEQCVAVMQPQANRERIIIRTSLAHALPSVKADIRALRQIALNLIGNSIHAANAGGQVIVSTAMTDFGDVVLRIRDSGQGLNDNEVAAAMAPFRTPVASDSLESENAGASLSLAKALVEANHAQFNIKTAPNAGTLIEVVFSHASAIA